jgi:hypothetical protein
MLGVRPRSCRRTKRSVNEPRSSGSLRISDVTLMGLCPLLAQSGHQLLRCKCPLLGVKRTFTALKAISASRRSTMLQGRFPTVSLNFWNNLRRVELLKELTQLMDEPDSKGVNLKVPERARLDLVGTGRFPGLVAGFEKRSGRC